MPALQVLDARQHVQVACRVLLDHVHDVVGPQTLLEPPLGHQELHDAEGEKPKISSKSSRDHIINDDQSVSPPGTSGMCLVNNSALECYVVCYYRAWSCWNGRFEGRRPVVTAADCRECNYSCAICFCVLLH